ncbi:MAG: hypothetical protein QS721_05925 [Candidatus Endonucleobacter sp. (ex Gigantidas childressi)]|nr:hypothetical protein [Candidatus Endonucleobacter sp. (ex Gigantidas childressi)]
MSLRVVVIGVSELSQQRSGLKGDGYRRVDTTRSLHRTADCTYCLNPAIHYIPSPIPVAFESASLLTAFDPTQSLSKSKLLGLRSLAAAEQIQIL